MAGAGERAAISGRQVAAAVIGNALEFYDFTTYTVFAVDIGKAFFPSHDPFVSLILSLATFAIGFVTRPIGALVIGALGDRVGRRPAMMLSFSLMGAAIAGLALTPGYAAIGLAAPILAILFRMIQGFALGGELGPVMAFLIEASPPARRGFIASWQSTSQSIASLAGAGVGLALAQLLSPHLLSLYGWRIAFWIGALVLPFGLLIRRALPETLHHPEARSAIHPERADVWAHAPVLALGVGVIMCFTTSTYVRLFLTTYATTTLKIGPSAAYGASVVNGLVGVAFTPLGGLLSDRHGRKPVMIAPLCVFLVVVYPVFHLIVRNHDALTLWIGTGVMGAAVSMSAGSALVWLSEALRKEVRSTAVGAVYSITVATFGGMTQPFLAWLLKATGNPVAPAFFLIATSLVGLASMLAMTETAPGRIAAGPAAVEL